MKKNIILLALLYVWSLAIMPQVTIGSGNPPHESAILDLHSSDKGFLGPRVSLTGRYDNTTVPNATPGLMVLNISQPDINQHADERVYPYRLYYWVEEGGARWERFIGQDELEYKLDREINKLSIPRPTMFYLDGKDMLSNNRPGISNFMAGITEGLTRDIPLMDSINHSGGAIRLKEGTPYTNTIVFQPGIYNIVFAYLFIPTTYNNITCNISSYFMDFPFYSGSDPRKSIRVYSSTYHNIREKSSHAATINFVAPIREETEWDVKLGAGFSGTGTCTGVSGFSLPNRNTFLYITKVGNW